MDDNNEEPNPQLKADMEKIRKYTELGNIRSSIDPEKAKIRSLEITVNLLNEKLGRVQDRMKLWLYISGAAGGFLGGIVGAAVKGLMLQ